MILRRIGLFLALLLGAALSQVPEFAQQYRQRLGGAVDELNRIVARFDADAGAANMSRDEGIARLKAADDPFVRQRGAQIEDSLERATRFERQLQAYAEAGPFRRLGLMAADYDPEIARRAAQNFEPAVPVTGEGLASGLAGFAGGWVLFRLLFAPLTRRRRRAA